MEMKELIKDLTDAKALVLSKDAELGTLKASTTAAETQLAELQASVATLTAENAAFKATDLVALKASTDAALAFVREEADRLCVASGEAKLKVDTTLDELKASITTNRTKLSATFPVGGRSEGLAAGSAGTPTGAVAASNHAASFATR